MADVNWSLLERRINETWENTRGHAERFDRIEGRLERIERQMAVVVRLAQAREAEQKVSRELTEGFAALHRELAELLQRQDTYEARLAELERRLAER